ncbi:MAG: hypothetical protein IPM99_18965 [Rubrivivax sp.]|nr:hypothetical protein [Rubrivivax sp.]
MTSPIVITGTLRADAQHRRTYAQGSLLSMDVTLPAMTGGRAVVARIVHNYGSGEAAAYAAKARAARLRTGVRVTVHAQGAEHRRGVLVLQQVQRIDEPDLIVRNVTGEREA